MFLLSNTNADLLKKMSIQINDTNIILLYKITFIYKPHKINI